MEIPEEVVVAIEGEDRATPTFRQVGRSFVLLGSNVAYLSRELGIQSPLINVLVQGSLIVGHAMRAAAAAQTIWNAVAGLAAPIQAAQAAANTAVTVTGYSAGSAMAIQSGMNWVFTGSAAAATTANVGLAASFQLLFASMGPVSWALMGISAILGVVGGYALAGGFGARGAPAPMATLGAGPFHEPSVKVDIHVGTMSTTGEDPEEIADRFGTAWNRAMRKYRP